jgi:transposase InsO family protein
MLWFNTFAPPCGMLVDMPYTMNPNLPRLRMQIAKLVFKQGWSTREAARYSGYNHSTIVRWVAKARLSNELNIPTQSCRPHHHPLTLSDKTRIAILEHRTKYHRCAEVIHYQLNQDGISVSLSSVKRTLKRNGLTYPSKWKKWHVYPERPLPAKPGILVEIDSMREGLPQEQLYLYVLIDVCSRYGFAKPVKAINSWQSARFFQEARQESFFPFLMIQSDHGGEFAKWFSKRLIASGVAHRHSRVRRPTDNGHVERFIRTIQQECLVRTNRSLKAWEKAIPEFIHYYNTERPHMGLEMKTPLEVVQSY